VIAKPKTNNLVKESIKTPVPRKSINSSKIKDEEYKDDFEIEEKVKKTIPKEETYDDNFNQYEDVELNSVAAPKSAVKLKPKPVKQDILKV
jgi:hypothetical protein